MSLRLRRPSVVCFRQSRATRLGEGFPPPLSPRAISYAKDVSFVLRGEEANIIVMHVRSFALFFPCVVRRPVARGRGREARGNTTARVARTFYRTVRLFITSVGRHSRNLTHHDFFEPRILHLGPLDDVDNVDDAEMSIFVIACAMVASSSSSVQVTMPPPVFRC